MEHTPPEVKVVSYRAATTGRTTYRTHFAGPLLHALDPAETVEGASGRGRRTGTTLCGLRGMAELTRPFEPEAARSCPVCRRAVARAREET